MNYRREKSKGLTKKIAINFFRPNTRSNRGRPNTRLFYIIVFSVDVMLQGLPHHIRKSKNIGHFLIKRRPVAEDRSVLRASRRTPMSDLLLEGPGVGLGSWSRACTVRRHTWSWSGRGSPISPARTSQPGASSATRADRLAPLRAPALRPIPPINRAGGIPRDWAMPKRQYDRQRRPVRLSAGRSNLPHKEG
jgi:hypothetical protein